MKTVIFAPGACGKGLQTCSPQVCGDQGLRHGGGFYRPKKTQQMHTNDKSIFSHKFVFRQFSIVFERSGGVQGHGMDHTMLFPRTLAGFGLLWHGGCRFSCFLDIGNSLHHQIPPNLSSGLQIGPWSFLKGQGRDMCHGPLPPLPVT